MHYFEVEHSKFCKLNFSKGTIVTVLEVKKKHTLKDLTINIHDLQYDIRIQGCLLPYLTLYMNLNALYAQHKPPSLYMNLITLYPLYNPPSLYINPI